MPSTNSNSISSSYTLLGHLLSLGETGQGSNLLSDPATSDLPFKNATGWNLLLHQANIQYTPTLWYARLRDTQRLQSLPDEMQQYLESLTEENRERNRELMAGLEDVLLSCNEQGITPILLKGAASLALGYYQDFGERILLDLDLLVHAEQVPACEQILVRQGFTEIEESFREADGLATDDRHNHINPYVKAGTPLAVEIHTRTAYALSGSVLPAEATWADAMPLSIGNARALALSPTHQAMLNILHALLPKREFINGEAELRQLAELDRIARHYKEQVDWEDCLKKAGKYRLRAQFSAYITLANQLFDTNIPLDGLNRLIGRLHAARIRDRQNLMVKVAQAAVSVGLFGRARLILHKLYYLLSLPGWTWNHPCYAAGWGNFPDRVIMLVRKLGLANSWRKI